MKRKRNILGIDVGNLLREETLVESSLGTVPDHTIDDAISLMIERLTLHIKSYILQDRSRDPVERNEAINRAAKVLDELETEVKEIVKEKLMLYSRE